MKQAVKWPLAFRDKYLAAIIAALICSVTAFGQTAPSRLELQPINAKGYEWQTGSFRKALYLPDTLSTADSGCIAQHAGVFYFKKGTTWITWGKAVKINDSTFTISGDTITLASTGGGGGGIATIKAAGAGFKLALPPDSVRSIDIVGTWLFGDTTTDRTKLRMGVDPQVAYGLGITPVTDELLVDTTGAFSLVPQERLRDTAAAIRAAIGSGGATIDSAYLDSVVKSKPYDDRKVITPQGSGLIVEGNSISQTGTSPYETYANMLGRFIGAVNNYSVGGSSVTIVGTMLRDGHLPLRRSQVALYNNGVNDIRYTKHETMKQLMGHTIRSFLCNSFRTATVDASAMTQTAGTWSSYSGLTVTDVSKTNCLQTTDNGATLSFTVTDGSAGLYISFITNAYDDGETWSDSVEIYRSNGAELIATVSPGNKGPFNNAPFVVFLPASNIFSTITIVNRKAAKLVVDYAGTTSPGGAPALVAEITKVCTPALQPGIGHDWWDTVNLFIRHMVENEFIRYGYPAATIDVNTGLRIDDPAHFHELVGTPSAAIHPSTQAHAEVLLPQTLKKIAFSVRQRENVEYATDVVLYTAAAGVPGQNKTIILPVISQNSGLNYNVSAVDIGQELTIINGNNTSFTWNAEFWTFIEPDGSTGTLFPSQSVTKLMRTAEGFRVIDRYHDSLASVGGGGPGSNVFDDDLYVRSTTGNVTKFALQNSGSMDLLELETASDASASVTSLGALSINGGSGVIVNAGATTRFGTNGMFGHNVTPTYRLDIYENGTGLTSGARTGNFVSQAQHNTTGGAITSFGVYSLNSSTRTSGGNNLMNIGVYGRATDGQINYAVYSDGKLVITAADSAASPTNMMWIDKTTNEVKIAAVPSGGSLSGSGTSGQLALWNGTSSFTGNSNILWGTSNGPRLSIGTTNTQGVLNIGGDKELLASGAQSFFAGATYNDDLTATSGTASSYTINVIGSPTISATNTGVTFPTITTLGVEAPAAGINATITNRYAITTGSNGHVKFQGNTEVDGALMTGGAQYNAVTTINSTGTLATNVYWIEVNATSGNITLTLPAASSVFTGARGIVYKLARVDASGNTVTVQRAGSDTIGAAGTSFSLNTADEVKTLQCVANDKWRVF